MAAKAVPERQTSRSVLLVEPAGFAFNPETAASNIFAHPSRNDETGRRARAEFDRLARRLARAGVEVHMLADPPEPAKPDAVFPNNWVSFHSDGTVVTYPMATPTRRRERQTEPLRQLLRSGGFDVAQLIDLSRHENDDCFLEGTGSLVLDRPRRRAYACLSERTSPRVIADFDARLGYSTFTFAAADPAGRPIYHTNVMMSLGRRFALLCLDAVAPNQRRALAEDLEAGGRSLIEVDFEQLRRFACNIIELEGGSGQGIVAMSSGARRSLRKEQVRALEELAGEIVHAEIPTIEQTGGGGVRCMIAELHLPRAA